MHGNPQDFLNRREMLRRSGMGFGTLALGGLLADAGGGHGLTAMRERTQRLGGAARAGPTADGWLVELEVPA